MADIFGNGIDQGELVDLFVTIRDNFNAVLTKLDSDTGVTDTNYNSLAAITLTSGIDASNWKSILHQGLIADYLDHVIARIAVLTAKLDADVLVGDTDYAATWDITDIVGGTYDSINGMGTYQGSLVNMLNDIIATINGINAKLDADSGVTDTDYASLHDITDNVAEEGTVATVS